MGSNVMWRLLSVLIMAGSFVFPASSQSIVKEGVEESYTIKKGDSLWKVAEHFLENPKRWKEIWLANPQIKNPNLLYPGDVVTLLYVDGKPRLTVSSRDTEGKPLLTESKRKGVSRTIKMSPKIKATSLDKKTIIVPLSQIARFLSVNRIFKNSSELAKAPYIFSMRNHRIIAGPGDQVYIRGYLFDRPGRYAIIREGKKILDPFTGKVSGVEGIKIADAKLIHLVDGKGVVEVLDARMSVKIGDRLFGADVFVPELEFFPKTPNETVTGKLLAVVGERIKAGKYDSVIISLGAREGLQPGDMLAVQESSLVRDEVTGENIRLPIKKLGSIMVYRPFERLSYGIVMSAIEDLQVGDDLTNY